MLSADDSSKNSNFFSKICEIQFVIAIFGFSMKNAFK